MESVLDERYNLVDLLDPPTLKEVCQALTQCFGYGVRVVSLEGQEMLETPAKNDFCRMVQNDPMKSTCEEARKKMAKAPLDAGQVLQSKTACGMRYAIFPMIHQLEIMGRVIVGPFRSPEDDVEAIKSSLVAKMIKPVTARQIERIPAIVAEDLKLQVRLMSKILEGFLFINAKRMVTTRLHLQNVFSSREEIFRSVERQDSGTDADREEIERLKNMF